MQTKFFEGAIVRLKHPENYPSSPAITQGGLTRIVEINAKSERVRVEGIDAMLSEEEIMGVSIMADNDLQHIELDFAIKHPFPTNGCGACEDKPFALKMRSCFKYDLQDYFDEYNKSLCTLIMENKLYLIHEIQAYIKDKIFRVRCQHSKQNPSCMAEGSLKLKLFLPQPHSRY